jgi:hypothetical protein
MHARISALLLAFVLACTGLASAQEQRAPSVVESWIPRGSPSPAPRSR